MNLFDRMAAGLDRMGRKANLALDEGKLRVELMRVRRRMDQAARDLGYIAYRQGKGEQAPAGEIEALSRRIAQAEVEVARLQAALARLRGAAEEARPDATAPPEAAPEPSAGSESPASDGPAPAEAGSRPPNSEQPPDA
jgi:uncharacterized coiled-coil protein SlyX